MTNDSVTRVAAVEAAVDTSDLDMLDETVRHGYCTACNGDPVPLGVPFVGLCGTRSIHLYRLPEPSAFPPNACPECMALWTAPCQRCGL